VHWSSKSLLASRSFPSLRPLPSVSTFSFFASGLGGGPPTRVSFVEKTLCRFPYRPFFHCFLPSFYRSLPPYPKLRARHPPFEVNPDFLFLSMPLVSLCRRAFFFCCLIFSFFFSNKCEFSPPRTSGFVSYTKKDRPFGLCVRSPSSSTPFFPFSSS